MKARIFDKAEIIAMLIGIVMISVLFVFILVDPQLDVLPLYAKVVGNIIVSISIWVGCRLIVNFLWRKFPWEKEPLKHLFIEVIAIPLWALFVMYLNYLLFNRFYNISDFWVRISDIVLGLLITLFITSLHECAFFYSQWKQHFALSVKLEKDNLEARYETLKAQLNPHFLFNSLNTLITYVEENPKATNYIQNLSEFMRYVLKNREKELVQLNEELEVCRKYLFLQQSRFGENLKAEIIVDKKYEILYIPPLTIQMLIENAVKHNVISREKPLTVKIGIDNDNYIYVENNLQVKTSEASNGMGLKNISDRYAYLSQQEIYQQKTTYSFKVSLPLLKVNV